MKTLLLTGGTGLVGSRITELLSDEYHCISLSSAELDITNAAQVSQVIGQHQFDYCLHLAAYTNVDGAETDYDAAYALNVTGTTHVFEAVQQKQAGFVLFSTDFVFDGNTPPYTEESPTNPISAYGKTKLLAEEVVQGKAMIIRLSFPYRATFEKKKDFVRTIISLLEQQKELKMITDSTFTPTFIDDIAEATRLLLRNYQPQVYHLVGGSSLSVYDAGKLIAKTFGLNADLISETTYNEFFAGRAQRPRYSAITSIRNTYPMKTFEAGLLEMKHQIEGDTH
jgi:dTDP-4-dehydrorhamnose reductase